ncbi:OmpA family protein [Marivirga sp.]|uniref:OmpA family protein n=1 Tax=Marivirga sp. TaxID=2018662 RepID=UPI002D7FE92B|nr:OmpA family protein [Marivirga sp.]HET8858369.1 OmpA family protein [Marivirga sp.]
MKPFFTLILIAFVPFFIFSQEEISTEGLPGNVNSSTQDVRPIISDDGKKLYLNRRFHPENIRGEKDFQDVWVSEFDSRGIWTKPKNLGENYNNKQANDLVRASKNDDSLIFVNARYRGVSSELALFTKGSTDPKELPIDGYYNNNPYVDFDYNFKHKVILMAVERKDSEGDQDLYYSVYQEDSKRFSTPMSMGEALNSEKADFAPFLTNDGNTIFFASYGHNGQGAADIFMAYRTGDSWNEWTEPENLGAVINTKFEETFVSIDPSLNYLYYDSYPANSENRNIWRATLSDEIKEKIIAARNKSKQTKMPTPDIEKKEEIILEPIVEKTVVAQNAEVNPKQEQIGEVPSVVLAETKEVKNENGTQPNGVTIIQEMDYQAELEATKNQGFFSRIGQRLGIAGKEEDIKLIDVGSKGMKINRNIYFEFDSEKLPIRFNNLLDQIAAEMKKQQNMKLLLEGHTDGIGGEDINIDLSCNRANNVKDALVARGLNPMRIEISCEGKERPIASNDDEFEGRELNRRVEFYIF